MVIVQLPCASTKLTAVLARLLRLLNISSHQNATLSLGSNLIVSNILQDISACLFLHYQSASPIICIWTSFPLEFKKKRRSFGRQYNSKSMVSFDTELGLHQHALLQETFSRLPAYSDIFCSLSSKFCTIIIFISSSSSTSFKLQSSYAAVP